MKRWGGRAGSTDWVWREKKTCVKELPLPSAIPPLEKYIYVYMNIYTQIVNTHLPIAQIQTERSAKIWEDSCVKELVPPLAINYPSLTAGFAVSLLTEQQTLMQKTHIMKSSSMGTSLILGLPTFYALFQHVNSLGEQIMFPRLEVQGTPQAVAVSQLNNIFVNGNSW